SARHYRHLYYSAPVALVSSDAGGTVLRWNDRADAWLAERLKKGRVNTLDALLGSGCASTLLAEVARDGRHRCELRVPGAPGEPERVCAIEASRVGDAVEISLVDVSERSRLADALEHMAHHDVLTEQLNRRGLERALDALLGESTARPSAIVYIDLDRFKAINDVFGHAVGDQRVGLPVAVELLNALTVEPCLADGLRLDVEASLGVVEVAPPMQTREAIALADEACSRSKRGGRGRITALRPDGDALDALRASVKLGSMLKNGLPVERLLLYAQPIVPLARPGAAPCSYEVLLRTRGDDGRIEPPGPLLEAAERHGGMPAIDRFVLERTVEHLAANPGHAASAGFFAVNLSGPSLNDERFVRDAVALLRAHRAIASKLCLEITEAVAVHDLRGARRCIDAFVDVGASIALDDFGAGYTSFAYLKHLPASMIKIDGQFVVGLEHDARQRGIVQAIARLAHELDMTCLAEWVESPATLRALLDLDVDFAQGFLFDRPRAIETWIERPVALGALRDARDARDARLGAAP
ncbi:MAG TPA: bifunctional diguanylate cyclase/phosphodiesterase, partial [Burkholderiaceae bacterium]|nr:bifunctional diguanylate cyclase/phosphodiesterase [Burkholderiaceae bacterium]